MRETPYQSAFSDETILGKEKVTWTPGDSLDPKTQACRRWIDDETPEFAQLFDQPWMTELTGLHLDFATGMVQEQFDTMLDIFEANIDKLQNLKALHMDAFDSAGLDVTRAFELLPHVEYWYIEGEGIECGVCRHHRMRELIYVYGAPNNLLSYGSFPSLTYLKIDDVSMEFPAIFNSAGLTQLRHLGFKFFEGTDEQILASMQLPKSLVSIELPVFTQDVLDALLTQVDGKSLEHLNISANFTNDLLEQMNKEIPNLSSLTFDAGEDAINALSRLELPKLRALALDSCDFSDDDLETLFLMPWLDQLHELRITNIEVDLERLSKQANAKYVAMRDRICLE